MKVLYCDCAYADVLPVDVKREVLKAISGLDVELIAVADLCGLAANKDRRMTELAGGASLRIVACHPRAVKWLFHQAGAPLAGNDVEFFNMRSEPAAEIMRRVSTGLQAGNRKELSIAARDDDWIPWFPTIDYARCNDCGQCQSFCLFGVYESDKDGKVSVVNPTACKTNCAACARICPEVAIIFAKEKQSPIDGGEVVDEELERRKVLAFKKDASGDEMRAYLAERRRRGIARRQVRNAKIENDTKRHQLF